MFRTEHAWPIRPRLKQYLWILYVPAALYLGSCAPAGEEEETKVGQVAHLATLIKDTTPSGEDVVIRVLAVDEKRVAPADTIIAITPGRHRLTCQISPSAEALQLDQADKLPSRLVSLELTAVKDRDYRPAYAYGAARYARLSVLERLDRLRVDPELEDYVPNTANRTDDCSGCAPMILMWTDQEPGWNEVIGRSRTIGVQWEITTPEPVDHIDVRLYRRQSTPPYEARLRQLTVEPELIDGEEQVPTAMYFDPSAFDHTLPASDDDAVYRTYLIHASVVDKLGKGSHVACRQINLKYLPADYAPEEEDPSHFMVMAELDPMPPIGCHLGGVWDLLGFSFDLPENTIIADNYEYERDGATRRATVIRPAELVIDGTVGTTLSFINNDDVPHRFISVYNPVYRETDAERYDGHDPHSIGGVSGLDFGMNLSGGTVEVPPGSTVDIQVPPAEAGDRQRVNRTWTLWDFVDNDGQIDSAGDTYDRTYRHRIRVRVWYMPE